jgi:hypothetical protein
LSLWTRGSRKRVLGSSGGRVEGRGDGFVSTLDLLADGLTCLVGPDWDGSVPSADVGAPAVTVERLDAIAARGLGLTTGGALLARPDGQPVTLWNDAPGLAAPEQREELQEAAGR